MILLAIYCALILLASLFGGWLPLIVRLTHTRLQVATSFVAGLMLGVGVLHLVPPAWEQFRSADRKLAGVLVGLVCHSRRGWSLTGRSRTRMACSDLERSW